MKLSYLEHKSHMAGRKYVTYRRGASMLPLLEEAYEAGVVCRCARQPQDLQYELGISKAKQLDLPDLAVHLQPFRLEASQLLDEPAMTVN